MNAGIADLASTIVTVMEQLLSTGRYNKEVTGRTKPRAKYPEPDGARILDYGFSNDWF
jgi:hypothetical protein